MTLLLMDEILVVVMFMYVLHLHYDEDNINGYVCYLLVL